MPQQCLLSIPANLSLSWFWDKNRAYSLCWILWRYKGAQLSFSWPYMIVSIIWITSELSASHLIRATSIFVPIWMLGLKIKLMTCAKWLAVELIKAVFFLTLYESINDTNGLGWEVTQGRIRESSEKQGYIDDTSTSAWVCSWVCIRGSSERVKKSRVE